MQTWQRLCLIAAFITAYPVTFALRLGQFSMILLASWTAAYMLLRRGRDHAAGAALAPLLIKPELLIPVALFLWWKRHYGVFATLLPLTAAAVAVSFAVVGPSEGLRYPYFLLENAGDASSGARTDWMFGWNGLIASFLGGDHPMTTTLLAAPPVVLTLAAAAFVWRGPMRPDGAWFPRQWVVLTLATVLADPNFFLQDIVIVFPALFTLLAASRGQARATMALAVSLAWVLCGLGINPGARWHTLWSAREPALSRAAPPVAAPERRSKAA